MGRSYDYYENITTHDSSLSACIHSIMASRLNHMEKAEDYFRRTAFLDIKNEHGNTKDGLHTANLGGAYLCIVAGFAGLRIKKDGLTLRPRIPRSLLGYRFRIWYGKSLLECAVERDSCQLRLIEGQPVDVCIFDRMIRIEDLVHIQL
jgi:alpha,alpha-trehalose phosphorylase